MLERQRRVVRLCLSQRRPLPEDPLPPSDEEVGAAGDVAGEVERAAQNVVCASPVHTHEEHTPCLST